MHLSLNSYIGGLKTFVQLPEKFWRRFGAPLNEKSAQLVVLQLVTLTLAEREGFEPPVPLSTPVFKTGAIDHSAISPYLLCKSWKAYCRAKHKDDALLLLRVQR